MTRGLKNGFRIVVCLFLLLLWAVPSYAEDYQEVVPFDETYVPENGGLVENYGGDDFDEWQESFESSPSTASRSSAGRAVVYNNYYNVFDGSVSSSVKSYFSDVVEKLPSGYDYVLFRQDRYVYRFVYADDLVYDNGRFSSVSARYVLYNTDTSYVTEGEEGSFSLLAGSYVVYTSVPSALSYPVLKSGVKHYEFQTLLFMLGVIFIYSVVDKFFFNGRYRW